MSATDVMFATGAVMFGASILLAAVAVTASLLRDAKRSREGRQGVVYLVAPDDPSFAFQLADAVRRYEAGGEG